MMTNVQYLLGKLAEEAGELAQIAIKAQQFGLEETKCGQDDDFPTNAARISAELNDVLGVVKMLQIEEDAKIVIDREAQTKKMNKVDKWREYSRQLGKVK